MKNINLLLAKKHLWEWRTISGLMPTETLADWYEMYRDVFLDKLENLGVETDEQLAEALGEVVDYKYVGDFILVDHSGQLKEFAAFGLVLFDRLARAHVTSRDVEEILFTSGQLFECFQYVVVSMDRMSRARAAAETRHSKSNSARKFIEAEWAVNGTAYKHNKSAFARDYVKRVWNELGIQVTEKHLKEVWLKNTQSASKQAVMPADG